MKALLTAAVLVLSASAFAAGTTSAATTTTAGTAQTAQAPASVKVAGNSKSEFRKECKSQGLKGKALKKCVKDKVDEAKGAPAAAAPAAQ